MKISAGKTVAIEYTLKLEDGEIADSNVGGEPLQFEFGSGQIIPGLESGIEGLGAGETASVEVAPTDGYGDVIQEHIVTIAREQIQGENLDIGMNIQSQSEEGHIFNGTISSIDDDEVTIDFNHPMAGKTLFFDVTVLSVQ
ncbi:MAG: peptidylprolyl isomerase [Gammaproteobacteria bacterium]|nr:MAG: peptidylprolyl isomerase [Gammaproteobacteria bacterium]